MLRTDIPCHVLGDKEEKIYIEREREGREGRGNEGEGERSVSLLKSTELAS
jgi:hypothetical protein